MNAAELFQFLRGWILSVLPTDSVLIQANQDGPAPKTRSGVYLVLEAIGSWDMVGQTSRSIQERPDLALPRVTTYRGTMQLREVGGLGDLLRDVLESIGTQDAVDTFSGAGLSILSTQGPTAVPSLQGSQWRQEQVLTLTLLWTRADDGLKAGETADANAVQSVEVTRESGPSNPSTIFVQKPV